MSGDGRDVSGVWYGRWSSTDPFVDPNSFIAVLEEMGGAVDGSISETDPEAPEPLRATVSGARTGAQIHWIKQYEGRWTHAVYYAGTVNDDATEISGGWRLDQWSGSFAMRREKFSIEELEADREIVLVIGPGGDSGLER
ncbi:hypothetical protein IAG41_06165 [Sphingomonas sp. JC676]|uniref:hypothetical protein n=1 Tax=Sphingomonas sp. JC676 TaxID=2768065 RepID=UPI0016583420|nr:hypothetical protein [Sphingomonas sp. JC676]MBC9031971.1 hypothetical protein [Sphingomonas sp. JC676]